MQFEAEEKLAHILVQEVPETIFVEILRLKLIDEATKDARLPPLEERDPEIRLLLLSLEHIYLSFLPGYGAFHQLRIRSMFQVHPVDLRLEEFLLVGRQLLLLLLQVLLLPPFLGVQLRSQLLNLLGLLLVSTAALIEHLINLSGSLSDALLHHLDELLVGVVLVLAELLRHLLDDG